MRDKGQSSAFKGVLADYIGKSGSGFMQYYGMVVSIPSYTAIEFKDHLGSYMSTTCAVPVRARLRLSLRGCGNKLRKNA